MSDKTPAQVAEDARREAHILAKHATEGCQPDCDIDFDIPDNGSRALRLAIDRAIAARAVEVAEEVSHIVGRFAHEKTAMIVALDAVRDRLRAELDAMREPS